MFFNFGTIIVRYVIGSELFLTYAFINEIIFRNLHVYSVQIVGLVGFIHMRVI